MPANEATWFKDAVFYQILVRSFYDSNGDGKGDFRGLAQKLDYIRDLGVDCIWVMPMYPSPLLDDGYDISSFLEIHPDLGTVNDFRHFVDAAHARGLKVITDLVMNHISDQHPWFQEARLDPESPKHDYFVWAEDPNKYSGARVIFIDTEPSNWTFDPVAGKYFWHRFFFHQPDLNFDNPEVWREMFEVARFWLNLGLDGFRCDAVPYLYEREGTNCENLPETHGFLRALRRMIETEYPGKILLAEANQWPEDVVEYFGTEEHPEFHMNFHFPVMPRIFMSIRRHDRSHLVDILRRTPEIRENCQWATFLRNHDELTLEMVTIDERHYMWSEYAPEIRMRSNLGIRRRLAPLLGNDRDLIELANALVLSLPGSPCMYYGDELGMGDNIWLRDRNGVRTPMQWSFDRNAGFSTASELWAPVINDPEYGYQHVNVVDQEKSRSSLLNWVRKILQVRRQHPAFGRGTLDFILGENQSVLSYLRNFESDNVLCVLNLSPTRQNIELDLEPFAGWSVTDAFSGMSFGEVTETPYRVSLAPYGFHWLILDEPAVNETSES
jgi:maltose alpha-D-glucosyltransferase / alpha-amylase